MHEHLHQATRGQEPLAPPSFHRRPALLQTSSSPPAVTAAAMSSTAVLSLTTAQLPPPTTAPPPPAATTASATSPPPPSPTTMSSAPATTTCCSSCGRNLATLSGPSSPEDLQAAQARIEELESQVQHLNHKASVAVDRWAAYEAELSQVRAAQRSSRLSSSSPPSKQSAVSRPLLIKQQQQQQQQQQQLDPTVVATPSPTRTSFLQSAPSRLSALLYPRKSTQSLRSDTPPPSATTVMSAATTEDLLEALTREQALRREAEGRLSATSKEIEELSTSLFEQANEMVADERRARARLEERVGELEKRDVEKRRRLERLELAMQRIEKVRKLLDEK